MADETSKKTAKIKAPLSFQNQPAVSSQVIDFGSSCFVDDHLSSYVQSRSYRAPEARSVELVCSFRQFLTAFVWFSMGMDVSVLTPNSTVAYRSDIIFVCIISYDLYEAMAF